MPCVSSSRATWTVSILATEAPGVAVNVAEQLARVYLRDQPRPLDTDPPIEQSHRSSEQLVEGSAVHHVVSTIVELSDSCPMITQQAP